MPPIPVHHAVGILRSLVAMKFTRHPPHPLHITQMQASGPSLALSAHRRRRYGLRRIICRRRNKLGKWCALTSHFRDEKYNFRRKARARRCQARRGGVQSIFIWHYRPSTSGDMQVRKSCAKDLFFRIFFPEILQHGFLFLKSETRTTSVLSIRRPSQCHLRSPPKPNHD